MDSKQDQVKPKKWYQYGIPASAAAPLSGFMALLIFVATAVLGVTEVVPRWFFFSGMFLAVYFFFGWHFIGGMAWADKQFDELKERVAELEKRLPKEPERKP